MEILIHTLPSSSFDIITDSTSKNGAEILVGPSASFMPNTQFEAV